MKIAEVIHVHKHADPTLITNYRPISLLPAFYKLLEHNLFIKVTGFLQYLFLCTNMVRVLNILRYTLLFT